MDASSLGAISDKVLAGEALSFEEALLLHEEADLCTLQSLADTVRRRLHPEPIVTYIVDRNINPTNVCVTDCDFCAFYRRPHHEEAYVLPREAIHRKVEELFALGGRVVLMQGGHHPHLRTDWYCELFEDLKRTFPGIHLHALSPPEIDHLAKLDRSTHRDVLERLRAAGLDSLPGGGAEILVDRVRAIIAPKKCSSDTWLAVMREAHRQGLFSTATMMYGHVETPAERIEHLMRLRDLQQETGGFTAFACWNYQNDHGVRLRAERTTPAVYFRVVALSRIVLANVPSIQASYVTQGVKAAQASLFFGVNDFGGGMIEENVVSAAGTNELVTIDEIERRIREAGFVPMRRDFFYGYVDRDPARPAEAVAS